LGLFFNLGQKIGLLSWLLFEQLLILDHYLSHKTNNEKKLAHAR